MVTKRSIAKWTELRYKAVRTQCGRLHSVVTIDHSITTSVKDNLSVIVNFIHNGTTGCIPLVVLHALQNKKKQGNSHWRAYTPQCRASVTQTIQLHIWNEAGRSGDEAIR